MTYDLPTGLTDNGQGLLIGFAKWAYTVTNGWFWALALLAFCIVIMMATIRFGTPRSFGTASFVGALGATFLAIAQLVSWPVASIFILIGFIGFGVMILNER